MKLGQEIKCPKCGSNELEHDGVDIGVGIEYGPWYCLDCGWVAGEDRDVTLETEGEEWTK